MRGNYHHFKALTHSAQGGLKVVSNLGMDPVPFIELAEQAERRTVEQVDPTTNVVVSRPLGLLVAASTRASERVPNLTVNPITVVVSAKVAVDGTGEDVHSCAERGVLDRIPGESRPDEAAPAADRLDPQELRFEGARKLCRYERADAIVASLDRDIPTAAVEVMALEDLEVRPAVHFRKGNIDAGDPIYGRPRDDALWRRRIQRCEALTVRVDHLAVQHHAPEVFVEGCAQLPDPVVARLELERLRRRPSGLAIKRRRRAEAAVVERGDVPSLEERVRPDAVARVVDRMRGLVGIWKRSGSAFGRG